MDENNGAAKLGLIALVIIAGIVLAFGFLFKSADNSQQRTTTELMTRQQQMMREALDMARQAQELNRARMEMVQREVEGTQEEYASGASADADR